VSDDAARVAYILSDELRVWLRRRHEAPNIIASAVVYELAALIASGAETVEQAEQLIDVWTDEMKDQVRRLGVGVEHP
jgi:hypothetical protein